MINEKDIIDILAKIKHIGIDVWIDGGWGVDALLGQQTRPHNDIDIFVQKKNSVAFIKMLISNDYRETKMEYTSNDHTVWCDPSNHIIDLHLFEFTENGTLYYDNEIYHSEILNGKGTIGGIIVRCLTAEAQLLYHQGYEHSEKDRHDVLLLCEKFGFIIPEEYTEQ
jgi:lincosamide nucleotidyltransferase A/C/D/E